MQQQTGVTFATHDGVALLGDLYLPEGAGPHPAVIAVHGGGWQQGTRAGYRHWGP
jgi:acetyl esterase/lipase